MKIAVCLKHVPDPLTIEVDPLSGVLDESRLLYVTNPADESALELALRLRETAGRNAPLRVLSVGPARAEAALREALAVGATHALRIWDGSFAESNPPLTARLLAAALRREGLPDLLLCGARSSDQGSGLVPALLAEELGWPLLTDVTRIEAGRGVLRVQRRLERGAREEAEVTLPAVLALEAGLARLRHAGLPGLLAGRRADIPVRRPAELGLAPADLSAPLPVLSAITPPRPRPRAIFTPDSARPAHERIGQIISAGVTRKSGKVLEGPPDQMAAAIIDFLQEQGFVDGGR